MAISETTPKIGTELTKQPSKVISSFGVNITRPDNFPYFAPKNCHLGQKVLKIHTNINMPISALNVHESPEFLCHIGNLG